MTWRPIRDTNALIEYYILLEFSTGIDSTFENIKDAAQQTFDFLPNIQIPDTPKFVISVGNSPEVRSLKDGEVTELRLSRTMVDGSDEWLLWAREKRLSVHCHYYSRWPNVWKKFEDLLTKSVSLVASSERKVKSIQIAYIDIFEWTANSDPRISKLLKTAATPEWRRDNPLSTQWHNHQGWFAKSHIRNVERQLERVHIDALKLAEPRQLKLEKPNAVKIEHFFRSELARPIGTLKGIMKTTKEVAIDCRKKNKEILTKLLQESVSDQINLPGGK